MKKYLLSIVLLGALQLSTLGQTAKPVCKSLKVDNTPCKSSLIDSLGYCRVHSPASLRCQGVKKDGNKCKMIVSKGEPFCHHHKPETTTVKK